MKKSLISIALATTMLLSACGADEQVIGGVKYDTYGVLNKEQSHNPKIQYEVSGWSIFWSVILVQTIIAPIYFIGFDLYEPVGPKDPNWVPGQLSPAPAAGWPAVPASAPAK